MKGSKNMDSTTWLCGPPPSHGQFQQYPSRFEYNLKKFYPQIFEENTLHMFSGAKEWGTTTDIREETGCDFPSPFDQMPFKKEEFDNVIADPPYANHWQNQWHGDLPKPKHILREAVKVCKKGGLIMILHIIIVPAYKIYNVERIALHPILTGPNNAIRVLNVFKKN